MLEFISTVCLVYICYRISDPIDFKKLKKKEFPQSTAAEIRIRENQDFKKQMSKGNNLLFKYGEIPGDNLKIKKIENKKTKKVKPIGSKYLRRLK